MIFTVTEYSELDGTHRNHQVQHLSEWPIQGTQTHDLGVISTISREFFGCWYFFFLFVCLSFFGKCIDYYSRR